MWAHPRFRNTACLCLVLAGIFGVIFIIAYPSTALHAASGRKACGLLLDGYKELGKLAEFKVALRCEAGQKEQLPVDEPVLIGLTATTSDSRTNDLAEGEYDFPVQNVVVSPETTTVVLTFHAQLSDISGKTHVYAIAWPRSFLQDCPAGRSGCAKFGYALAFPASLSKSCVRKDESGDSEIKDDFLCKGSADYRFKFR